MSLKNYFFVLFFLIIILGISNTRIAFASATNGTIDSTHKYAWGENIGWLNFGVSSGDIHVTDSGITGYAWSENYGWINMHANNLSGGSVTNDGEGILGGNAWAEGLGWIDFSGVTIDTDGYLGGYATIISDGSQISFNCSNTGSCGSSDFKVRTDWRPISSRPSGGGGGGSSLPSCTDGRQNGNETGVDCGGTCPLACVVFPVPLPLIPISTPSSPGETVFDSGPCPAELLITDNMKRGDRDGGYGDYNKGVVKQVALLQAHINRILVTTYKEAAGPVDGIYGPLTEQGVKRLQIALNNIVKPTPLLVIDGVVGPFTKIAINNSCGYLGETDISPTVPPNNETSIPGNVPILEKTVKQNIQPNIIINGVNNISTSINTYIITPAVKTIITIGDMIKTTAISFWHGFSEPIIYLFSQ